MSEISEGSSSKTQSVRAKKRNASLELWFYTTIVASLVPTASKAFFVWLNTSGFDICTLLENGELFIVSFGILATSFGAYLDSEKVSNVTVQTKQVRNRVTLFCVSLVAALFFAYGLIFSETDGYENSQIVVVSITAYIVTGLVSYWCARNTF